MRKTGTSKRSPSLATLLVSAVSDTQLLVDERGDSYARVKEAGGYRLIRLRSHECRLWLARRGRALCGEAISPGVVSTARLHLEACAQEGPRVTLWNRVARGTDGAIWLDLCDGRAVRVTAQGWAVVDDPPPLFRRFAHQEPLPAPVPGGDLRGLDPFLNLRTDNDRVLYHTSLVAAGVPDIPQPIAIMHGPEGATKTTAGRLRRQVLDPSGLETVIVPPNLGELVQALAHHYMPVFDNMTDLHTWQVEVFCQVSTGGGVTKRRLYSDQDDVLFRLRRPIVLTGINLPSVAPDFLDRAVLIGLEPVPDHLRRDERGLWREFNQRRPAILGGLLLVLSRAMAIEPELELPVLHRMADFTRWGAAAAEAMGIGAPRFCEALAQNRVHQREQVVADDPLAEALLALVQRVGRFSGTATELLAGLKLLAGPRKQAGLPGHPVALGRRLNALRMALAGLGMTVRPERQGDIGRQRLWIIEGPAGESATRDEEAPLQ